MMYRFLAPVGAVINCADNTGAKNLYIIAVAGPPCGRPALYSAGENTRLQRVGDKTLKPGSRFVGATRAPTAPVPSLMIATLGITAQYCPPRPMRGRACDLDVELGPQVPVARGVYWTVRPYCPT